MLSHLRLQNFRCFDSLSLDAPPTGLIILGDNAQGKTSLLEAICTLIRLQSPRTHRLNTLTKFDTPGFGVAADPWGLDRKIVHRSASLTMEAGGGPRTSRSEYLSDGGLVVWIGNEDLSLIRGPGENRRHFLDFLGAQLDPKYRTAYTRYRRALRAKNLLLREPSIRTAELRAYEEILIEHGTFITESRADLVAALSPLASASQLAISSRPESLTLSYLPASGPSLADSILQARNREIATRQAVVGPHRDDISIRLHGMPASDFASEGQQRTIALALKLAQGSLLHTRRDERPIYLLDDIFGELDPSRRNALLHLLPPDSQKFITTTHLGWIKTVPSSSIPPIVRLSNGTIHPN